MELLLIILVGTFLSWVSLVILIAIGQGIADLSVPAWPETLWKLAVMAAIPNALVVLLPINEILAGLIIIVVFWTLMVKWFQVDLLGAIILSVLSAAIRWAMVGTILALIG
ncbi:MAG: hypothetical protein GY794_21660 [bacterium]|nr:hypothetical protein [bacterium]